MSDVTVAAPSGGAPAPAEVPVQVDQTHAPNPVGSQAPDAPTGRNPKDAITRAFERAQNPKAKDARPPQRPAPKAAEARPGHNQPPDETKAEKLDLRKRPSGDVPKGPQSRDRGEHGHFAPKQPAQQGAQNAQMAAQSAQNSANAAQLAQTPYRPEHNRLPQQAPYREPPNRFANHAKHEWSAAPESIRAEVNRMYEEFGKAYKVYKADFDEMQGLRPFQQLAKATGTTMAKALSSYVALEDKIRKSPLAGLDTVVQNLGLKTAEGQPITLRDIAYYIATLTPEQYAEVQRSNAEIATGRQIAPARQEIEQLKQSWQQAQEQQQFHYTRSAVDNYANAHPRLDELGDLIEQEIKHGYDLDTAYRRANLLRPAGPAAQTRNPSAQTRPATDKSISGVPGSSNGARPRGKPSASPRDAVRNAISRMQGRA
jgi:hypothetical protein